MKLLFVSNGYLAKELFHAMQRFYTDPEIDVLCLEDAHMDRFVNALRNYVENTREELLILCDLWGSAAFNETVFTLQSLRAMPRSAVICGANLPMVFKLYGLKDSWKIDAIRSLYDEATDRENGIVAYPPLAS